MDGRRVDTWTKDLTTGAVDCRPAPSLRSPWRSPIADARMHSLTRILAADATRRTAIRALAAAIAAGGLGHAATDGADAGRRLRRRTYEIAITDCPPSNNPQYCFSTFERTVQTTGRLVLELTADPAGCSAIDVEINVAYKTSNFRHTYYTGELNPGETARINAGRGRSGAHHLDLNAHGIPGGCNQGTIYAWGGTLRVTTSEAKHRR